MNKCPSCGERLTVARSKKYDGFAVTGWEEKCIFCGVVTASSDTQTAGTAAAGKTAGNSGTENLAALLGENASLPKTTLKAEGSEGNFCRKCRHFLQHPFTPRCGLDNHAVDPMGDCGSFAACEE